MAKIKGTKFRDILTGTNVADAISGLAGNDDLYGGKGNDKLYGGDGNDKLFGEAGNDLLDGGKGADRMTGAKGNDTYVVDNVSDKAIEKAGQGIDTVKASITHTLSANVENLVLTGLAAINGTGNALNNVITGNAGSNVLDGGAGADLLIGGAGDGTYVVEASDTVSEASGAGTDTVKTSLAAYTLTANVENLTFTGAGNFTGTGNDLANVIIGGTATNTLYGGTGDDVLSGAHGVNALFGGDGTDTVSYAGAGPFTLTADFDYAFLHLKAGTQVGVNFNVQTAGSATYWAAEGDTFTSIENAIGSNYADLIDMYVVGTADGGGGNDSIQLLAGGTAYGGAGDDGIGVGFTGGPHSGTATIYGGDGNDQIFLEGSSFDNNVTVYGGAGDDVIQCLTTRGGFTYDGGDGNDDIYGTGGFETLSGGNGNDRLFGGSFADHLFGGAGNDLLDGGTFDDELDGGDGNDTASYAGAGGTVTASLQGGIGTVGDAAGDTYVSIENLTGSRFSDVLTGDGNANIITGGDSSDNLTGNGGADRFVFLNVSDSTDVLADNINDFSSAQGDKIDISALPGTFTFTTSNAFSGGGTPSLYVLDQGLASLIFGDTNGDGVMDFSIYLRDPNQVLNITAADFIL